MMASADSPQHSQSPQPPFYEPWIELLSAVTQQHVLLRLKSWSPQLVPVFICAAILPLFLLFSCIAGWIVWSSVPLGWSIPIHLQYGDGTIPYADFGIASLSTNQPYDISLQLTVPATETNYALGNFMTSLRMTTYANATLVDVRKPALVILPSPNLLPLSRAPRLLKVTVPLVSSLVIGASSVGARIELGRRDGWKSLGRGEGRELSVYEAVLHGVVRPQGLRRLVATFPLSFSITAAVIFFVVSVFILAGCLLPSIVQGKPSELDTIAKEEQFEPKSPVEGTSTVIRMRRRSSRVKEESDGEEGVLSPHIETSPESDIDMRRRLRRGSSQGNE